LPITIAAEGEFFCSFSIWVDGDSTSHAKVGECQTTDAKIDLVTGSATGTDSDIKTSATDCEEITIDPDPDIELKKELAAGETGKVDPAGDWVTYKVTITNNSTVESVSIDELTDEINGETLDLFTTTSALVQNNTCDDTVPLIIAKDSSQDCTFDYWVTGETTTATHDECPNGEIVDVVTAEGFGNDSKLDVGPVDDCEEIDVLPAVEVFKSTDTPNIPATGADVTFDVVIHNRTIHDLTLESLTDSVDGGLEYRIDSDSPGAVVINTTCDIVGLVLTGDDGNDASGTDQYTCEFTVVVTGVADQVVRDTVTVEGRSSLRTMVIGRCTTCSSST
jgi:hypothetical protein